MATIDEMKMAVGQIREYCVAATGKHADVLSELAERLSREELRRDVPQDEREAIIREQYFDAISTLLSLALPPNGETLERTLGRIGNVSKERPSDVQVMDVDGAQAIEQYRLRESLPKKRRMSKLNRAILQEFQDELPKTNWGRWVQPSQEGEA